MLILSAYYDYMLFVEFSVLSWNHGSLSLSSYLNKMTTCDRIVDVFNVSGGKMIIHILINKLDDKI